MTLVPVPADPQVLKQQTPTSTPTGGDIEHGTNLVAPPQRTIERLSNFPEEVYSLDPSSHLVRFMRVLLGDAGAGQVRKAYIIQRLRQSLMGSHFYDLDHFYGALFNLTRKSTEAIAVDPTTGTGTTQEWISQQQADANYRARISMFGHAFDLGGCPAGIELAAEAILSCDVEVYESYLEADLPKGTYGESENLLSSYGQMEGYTYGQLEALGPGSQEQSLDRYTFTIVPKQPITEEDRFQVLKALRRLKPATSIAEVDTNGLAIHQPVTPRGLWADSEYWEVVPRVATGASNIYPVPATDGTSAEQPRPAFSAYQGESWSVFADIAGVLSYAEDETTGELLSGNEFERVSYDDPSHTVTTNPKFFQDFDATRAIFPVGDAILGRAVGDGVLVNHPYPSLLVSAASNRPLYVDRIPMDQALAQLAIHPVSVGHVDADPSTRFWSTPERPPGGTGWYFTKTGVIFGGPWPTLQAAQSISLMALGLTMLAISPFDTRPYDPNGIYQNNQPLPQASLMDQASVREIIEVRLNAAHLINYVTLDVAHFPQDVTVEVFDEDKGQWVDVFTRSIRDSQPQVFFSRLATQFNTHPQHQGANHWVTIGGAISPRRTQRIRAVCVRRNGALPRIWIGSSNWQETSRFYHNNPMTNAATNTAPIPYSLGVRNFDAGYTISSAADIPRPPVTPPPAFDPNQPFGATKDVLGSALTFTVHQERAQGLLSGNQWRSEPQPIQNAVVNLYFDSRDETGNGQVIDRFYFNPTHAGPTCHLYYSDNDPDPTGTFPALDDPLPYGVATLGGSVAPIDDGLAFSDSDPSWLDVSNAAVQWRQDLSWWAGIDYTTGYVSTSGEHPIFDFGGNTLKAENGTIQFTAATGDVVSIPAFYPSGANVRVVVAYFPTATTDTPGGPHFLVYVQPPFADVVVSTLMLPQPLDDTFVTNLRFGANATGAAGVGALTLNHFVLKQAVSDATSATSFLATPDTYVVKKEFADGDDANTDNAILRISPDLAIDAFPLGIVGGPGQVYEALSWTPLERDFTLAQGFVHIPPTKAKFFKFEFTNLIAEPYENYVPITKTVKTFPPQVLVRHRRDDDDDDRSEAPLEPGMSTVMDNDDRMFDDEMVARGGFFSPTPAKNIYRSTDAVYTTDPGRRQALSDQSQVYNLAPWQPSVRGPMFDRVGVHTYTENIVEDTQKMAFFVGLSDFAAYRIIYDTQDDTQVYIERFWDTDTIASTDWNVSPNVIDSGTTAPVTETSKPLLSLTPVTALQFATRETPAVQLVFDDDFMDPAKITYTWDNPDDWHALGDASISYDQLANSVVVDRDVIAQPVFLGHEGGLIQRPIQPVFATKQQSRPDVEATARTMGGFASGSIAVSPRGQVWAAVRFTAMTNVTNPIHLQIVGTDGTIVADKPITAQQGELVETYVGYTLGSYSTNYTPPSGFYPRSLIDRPLRAVANYAGPTPVVGPPPPPPAAIDNNLIVRLVQFGPSIDKISIDTLSLFEDAVLWEFSNDGGATFIQAVGIKNNPNGVLTFPGDGNALVWRATSYRQNVQVSSLQIRPWYGRGLNVRKRTQRWGPNTSSYDQYPPIDQDPDFQGWTIPVPRSWWSVARKYPILPVEGAPITSIYARFYARNLAEDVSASFSETATRQAGLHMTRTVSEFIQLPPEQLVGGRFFARTSSDSTTITTAETAQGVKLSLSGDTPVVNPLPEPLF